MLSIVLEHYEANPRICFSNQIVDILDYTKCTTWVPVFPESGRTSEVGRIQKRISSLWNGERSNRFGDRPCIHKKLDGVITFTDMFVSTSFADYYDAGGQEYQNAFVTSFPDYPPSWIDPKGWVVEYDTMTFPYNGESYNLCITYFPYYDTWKRYQGYSASMTGARWDGSTFVYFSMVSPRYASLNEVKDKAVPWLRGRTLSLMTSRGRRALVGSLPDLDALTERIDKESGDWLSSLTATEPSFDPESVYGRLSRDILDSWSPPQINLPMYLRDLFKTASDLVKVAKSVQHLDLKSISDAYLSYKYGFSLSVKDTLDLGHYLTRGAFQYEWASGRAHKIIVQDDWVGMFAEKVYYSLYPSEELDLVDALFDNDVIGLNNTWDMIPFSFCVDWFLNIGDTLEQFDSTSRFNHFPVESCISTVKWERNLLDADVALLLGVHPTKSAVTFVDYRRTILRHMWLPKLSWDAPSQFNHYMEASALIISSMYRR